MAAEKHIHDSIYEMRGPSPVVVDRDRSVRRENEVLMWHEQLEIKLFHTAGTHLTIGKQSYVSQVDSIFVINSCELHSTYDINPNSYDLVMIDISGIMPRMEGVARKRLEAIGTGELVFSVEIKDAPLLKKRIVDLVENYTGKEEDELVSLGFVYLLLDELIKHKTDSSDDVQRRSHVVELTEKLAPAISMIGSDYTRQISVGELADACGISEKYFCKLFRERTGMSSVSYIHYLRCNQAKLLLSTTNKGMAEIADQCGFSEAEYFNRVFKKQVGCTPLKYRQQSRLKNETDK